MIWSNSWRERARASIEAAIANVDRTDRAAMKRAIDAAYPFGLRQHYPYKVWLEERRAVLDGVPGGGARSCPACGASPAARCVDMTTGDPREDHEARGAR